MTTSLDSSPIGQPKAADAGKAGIGVCGKIVSESAP
jgi:hypothetical protein